MTSGRDADEAFMVRALQGARRAAVCGDVPVGALVVRDGVVVGRGYNRREARRDLLGHAELAALRQAGRRTGDWRLEGATVYVTLEPCPMCAGAMLEARVERLVYGAADPRCGAAGSVLCLADYPGQAHHLIVVGDVLGAECRQLLEEFFRQRRNESTREG